MLIPSLESQPRAREFTACRIRRVSVIFPQNIWPIWRQWMTSMKTIPLSLLQSRPIMCPPSSGANFLSTPTISLTSKIPKLEWPSTGNAAEKLIALPELQQMAKAWWSNELPPTTMAAIQLTWRNGSWMRRSSRPFKWIPSHPLTQFWQSGKRELWPLNSDLWP